MTPEREQRIRERAYAIWLREGRPHGKDREHWRLAEAEVVAEEAAERETASSAAAAPSPDPPAEPPAKTGRPVRSRPARRKDEAEPAGEGRNAPRTGRRRTERHGEA